MQCQLQAYQSHYVKARKESLSTLCYLDVTTKHLKSLASESKEQLVQSP